MTSHNRYEELLSFLKYSNIPVSECNPCDCGCECTHALKPLNGDASFRRYYRLKLDEYKFNELCQKAQVTLAQAKYYGSVIVMDAPPETQKNLEFIKINRLLQTARILVPAILVKDVEHGFMVLEDLGNALFIDKSNNERQLAYYFRAEVEMLKLSCMPFNAEQEQRLQAKIAEAHAANSNDEFIIPVYAPETAAERYELLKQLPPFDAAFINMELGIFTEWLLEKQLKLQLTESEQAMLKRTFEFLTTECLKQPQVPMHRDFHSRNIMAIPENCTTPILMQLAVIDYQDMVIGPLGYDTASLLFDCYVKLDPEIRERLEQYVWQVVTASGVFAGNFEEFQRMVKICALQRHIKVLGIFNRLNLRDGKPGYLKDLPLVLEYVLTNCDAFQEMQEFKQFLLNHVAGKL